jgi:general transcriptional corepressor CYC8
MLRRYGPNRFLELLDPPDAPSWYLLGWAYMAGQECNKAYEAYQQTVY